VHEVCGTLALMSPVGLVPSGGRQSRANGLADSAGPAGAKDDLWIRSGLPPPQVRTLLTSGQTPGTAPVRFAARPGNSGDR
jgi:hypothetical protein